MSVTPGCSTGEPGGVLAQDSTDTAIPQPLHSETRPDKYEMSVLLLHPSSHSFFSCVLGDRTSKDRGMFDSLLDSRRPENTRPGDTPTLSLICHPMQVILCSPPWVALR